MNISKATALLLDLLPYEIPLIYSNQELYNYINNNPKWDELSIDNLILNETQPYHFYIYKNDFSNRLLSLLHPLAQLQTTKFIEKYDQELISFFHTHTIFSIRFPYDINSISKKPIDKIESDMNFLLNEEYEINNNEYEKYMDSYFSKKRFKKITDFYKSNLFKKLETKYSLLQKLDISNCFYSIYTHSIDWAYLGSREFAKKNRNGKRLSTTLDKVMSSSNYGETNGIIVGPEFSRIVAEIVLTRIDKLVYERIQKENLVYKRDFEIVRYIDDIFIFTNSHQDASLIKQIYIETSNDYKLTINESKAFLETNPFLKKHIWVVKLKKILKEYFSLFEEPKSLDKPSIRRATNSFLSEIRAIIIEFENDKHSIVSFILSSLEKVWKSLISTSFDVMKNNEYKRYLLFKFIDLTHYVLTFSLTAQNVLKYSKLTVYISNEAVKIGDYSIHDLIFSKTLEIIKYHNNKNTEILNLIIILKDFEKEIPENILIEILKKNPNYFTLSCITYYLSEGNRTFRYKKVRGFINGEINMIIHLLNEKYILPNTDSNKLKELVNSKEFYVIHDFYSSNILSKNTKIEIEKIKNRILKEKWDKDVLFNVFIQYIKDFDKPFMNWNASKKEMIKMLVEKTTSNMQAYD
ncbi:RNA-directed DNA polymerase [Bacillus sp. T33-2]|uniref:RNA-directed DNA polymerase n=1 Tax=Bacillus sp. T33-2 TaxID=2054168 RepID=UPI000C786E28|nr:RNA-directed DNA polymerase [Bacillus sp. T33-2]PLR94592.1 hypothetical protein CVD19_16600 [Bacillus sp. T33-2]